MNGQLLIVDDEIEICKSLSLYFKSIGYDVDIAQNGIEALNIFAKKRIDVLISDIVMPEMDGVELLGEVRKQYPMTRVIMITGYVTLENGLACMRRGADTFIFKPLDDIIELEEEVNTAIARLQKWNKKLKELVGMKPNKKGADNE